MKKSLIALAVMGASTVAFAASNVTLYGVIEEGVVVQKAKHQDTTVSLKSGFDQGSRWGIRGVEELGNGYSVGFILEQGFNADNGDQAVAGKQFSRESILYVTGGFGRFGFGRTGTLASGAQSNNILTGWALGTGFGLSAWTSFGGGFSRTDNAVFYKTPSFGGLTISAMYSNGYTGDDAKWSKNNHYYGIGAKYEANAIKSSLIFEAMDNKGTEVASKTAGSLFNIGQWAVVEGYDPAKLTDAQKDEYKAWAKTSLDDATAAKKRALMINYGLEYNMGAWTPMFAYQWFNQDGGKKTHMFGLSAKVGVAGGDILVGGRYLFGHDEALTGDDKVRAWNLGAAYIYPLSKRTALKAYAGYADSSKGWKDKEEVAYNGYQLYLGMRHSF
ncbi:porin [Turicimonas muris]|uniref:porin n=1 Tax=Turicimonas muris TaxID=1796652 RepID=UPI0024945E42|nr:porin [Turicimonas muris]